jgi:hypothetical protein
VTFGSVDRTRFGPNPLRSAEPALVRCNARCSVVQRFAAPSVRCAGATSPCGGPSRARASRASGRWSGAGPRCRRRASCRCRPPEPISGCVRTQLSRVPAGEPVEQQRLGVLRSPNRSPGRAREASRPDQPPRRKQAVGARLPGHRRPGAVAANGDPRVDGLRLEAGGQLPVPPALGHPRATALGSVILSRGRQHRDHPWS